jgi:3'(2'), 5'-bisphosphate nucleotidase
MWALDPIDGTKGFLRGEQYAVCLALIVGGNVQLGVMGCPNLPVDFNAPEGERGCLFVAEKGQGAFQVYCLLFKLLSTSTFFLSFFFF